MPDRRIRVNENEGSPIRRKPWEYTIPDNSPKPGDNVFGVYLGFGGMYHWVGTTNDAGEIISRCPYLSIEKLNDNWELDL